MKLVHITINTANLERSIEFYKNALGMEITGDLRNSLPIVFMKSENNEVNIELIENHENRYNGSGIFMGFKCENADIMHEKLEKEGYAPTPFVSPNPNVRFFFVTDPNGMKIQII